MAENQDPSIAPARSETLRWCREFMQVLQTTGNVSAACRGAGVRRGRVHSFRRKSVPFAQRWDEALLAAMATLWVEARRRAVYGVEEPVFYGGKQIGVRRRYSDSLLTLLLQTPLSEQNGEMEIQHYKPLPKIVEYDIPDRPAATRFLKLDASESAAPEDEENDAEEEKAEDDLTR